MEYVDEYRDPQACEKLIAMIQNRVTRPWTIMEVCGGQTHALLRYGIDQQLAGAVELIHGPGCPVCVTPEAAIDLAGAISLIPNTELVTFGDMMRVPGSHQSLQEVRQLGGDIGMVYSPLDAVTRAQQTPGKSVVFFAVGFETTTPATALAIKRAAALGLDNFFVLVAHVRVQPAMEMLVAAPTNRVQAFLAAGHVCCVTGYESYHRFAQSARLPIVVTGFEPLDLLAGVWTSVDMLESGRFGVVNRYQRGVSEAGNRSAVRMVEEVYEVCDKWWRGIGAVPGGGFQLREAYHRFDAGRRFAFADLPAVSCSSRCRSGEILSGSLKPNECEQFGRGCTPSTPLGAPMVSAEGACAAYFRYSQLASGS